MSPQTVLGTLEPVKFPEFSRKIVFAKIDTGAYTGALHCDGIEEKSVEGGKILYFRPHGSSKVYQKDEFVAKYVKSSNGKRQRRYFINTTIVIKGLKYEITLSLANRSEMRRQVLIGRRFLRINNFIVDPNASHRSNKVGRI